MDHIEHMDHDYLKHDQPPPDPPARIGTPPSSSSARSETSPKRSSARPGLRNIPRIVYGDPSSSESAGSPDKPTMKERKIDDDDTSADINVDEDSPNPSSAQHEDLSAAVGEASGGGSVMPDQVLEVSSRNLSTDVGEASGGGSVSPNQDNRVSSSESDGTTDQQAKRRKYLDDRAKIINQKKREMRRIRQITGARVTEVQLKADEEKSKVQFKADEEKSIVQFKADEEKSEVKFQADEKIRKLKKKYQIG